jgi:hypothetical protein
MANLAICAPRHRTIGLQAAGVDLAGAVTSLAAVIEEADFGPVPGSGEQGVQCHRGDPE